MNDGAANLLELFSSIQGEGVYVGQRQIFLRFHGCNMTCAYCDTVTTDVPTHCLIESTPGRRDFQHLANPVSLERVVAHLSRWQTGWPGIHQSISLTGGEPLLKLEIIQEWLPELHRLHPLYLETNGVLHNALSRVIQHIDIISMDIKLPSSAGCDPMWDHHSNFLAVAREKKVFVKVVVNSHTEEWEITRAAELVANQDRRIPFVLQPETGRDQAVTINPLILLEFQEILSALLTDVRVIPQTHKFIGQL